MHQSIENQPDGFESEDDFQEIQQAVKVPGLKQHKSIITQKPKFILPPANDIAAKVYNIIPDTITGWRPRLFLPKPVPLTFGFTIVDAVIKSLEKSQNIGQICYLGPREENSYYLHMNKSYPFPYQHIKSPEVIKLTNRQFIGNTNNPSNLKFDSMFQSGNLDCSIKVSEEEYDLFMRPDTNTKGYLQWYNFKVKNAVKGVTYKFNICNFRKHHSLYTRGMKPFVFSQKNMECKKIGWDQTGENIKYEKKLSKYLTFDDLNSNYRLSFEYKFEYANDEVHFSYCIPYTYSQLLAFLQQTKNKPFVKIDKLTMSLGSLQVPLLTITDDTNKQTAKKCVLISGRTHPGQSNASHMMHGFLQFLCGSSDEAQFLRRHVIFKIIPMLNVDGVIAGNQRTGLSGKDFNRQFVSPDKYILPQISALKDLVVRSKSEFGKNLLFFIDFHGHSIKKNVFMYGPQYSIRQSYYYDCKIFPKMLGNITNMFRYYSCMFRISQCKQTTARAILFKKLNIPFAYTLQASNGYFYDKEQMKNVMFTDKLWNQMGESIVKTIFKYCQELVEVDNLKKQKQKKKRQSAELRMKNKSQQGKRSVKLNNNFIATSQKLSYKRATTDLKISQTKQKQSAKEPQIILPPGSFRNILDEIKKQQQLIQQNPEVQKDGSMSSESSSQNSEDNLPQQIIEFIEKSIRNKKFQGLNSCSTHMKFSQEKLKELQKFQTMNDFVDSPSPAKKSIDLSPTKKQYYMKSNSTRVTLSKFPFPPSKSVPPRQIETKQISSVQQPEPQVIEKEFPKSKIINVQIAKNKYLNVTGESVKKQTKILKQGTSNPFVQSLKKSYNYYKQKQLVSTFVSDNFNRTFFRTTRKAYLFKQGRGNNYSSLMHQYT